jgi:hypothetical protein
MREVLPEREKDLYHRRVARQLLVSILRRPKPIRNAGSHLENFQELNDFSAIFDAPNPFSIEPAKLRA